MKAERFIYNVKLSQGILYNASGYRNPIYFITDHIRQLHTQRRALSHVRFTGQAIKTPHYHFTAWRLWFYPNDIFFATGVVYYVGGVPLLPLPFIYYNYTPWGTGSRTQLGRGQVQGAFIQNSYRIAIPEKETLAAWTPQIYDISLDYYQNTGQVGGISLKRFTPELDYQLDYGIARFQRYTFKNDKVSNEVERCEGSGSNRTCKTGRDNYLWQKQFLILNHKKSDPDTNHVRNIHLKYENYTHYLYEYEFGRRSFPETTLNALYEKILRDGGVLRPQIEWRLNYEERWDSLSFQLDVENKRTWIEKENFQDSNYQLVQELLPRMRLHKNFSLGSLDGIGWDSAFLEWNHNIDFSSQKDFSASRGIYFRNRNEYETDLNLTGAQYAWLSWDLRSGYGARKTTVQTKSDKQQEKLSLETEANRNSYQYIFSDNKVILGEDILFFHYTHRYKEPVKEALEDVPHIDHKGFTNNQKVNESEVLLEYYPFVNGLTSLNAIYDHRTFPKGHEVTNRWHYPVWRSDVFLDWLNLIREERESLLSRNKIHFLNTRITNDYIYDANRNDSHSNILGLKFETGGYDLYFLERLRYFSMGFQWYHVYFNPALDHLRYVLQMDVQLTKWVYWETILESRASEPGRYSDSSKDNEGNNNSISFWKDLFNSTGLNGHRQRRNAIFNVAYFRSGFIIDLYDWELRLDYEKEQRYILGLSNNAESRIYYDDRFSFSLNLVRFDIGRHASRPSRFIISGNNRE